jgi:hypothetical protein
MRTQLYAERRRKGFAAQMHHGHLSMRESWLSFVVEVVKVGDNWKINGLGSPFYILWILQNQS